MTIFEKIINREIPSHIIYEDDLFISFMDISQVTIGHCLLVCKKPYKDIFELPFEEQSQLGFLITKIALAVRKAFNVDSVTIVNNSGPNSGQEVFHFHVHILPRYENEKIKVLSDYTFHKDVDLELLKNKIIKAL